MARPDDSTWEAHDDARPFLGGIYSKQRVRMAVIGLGGGGLLVVSPGAPTSDARFDALAKWGTPRFLLAPNHFHNGGIAAWKTRFPEATVVAHERALPRLRKKVPGVDFHDLSALQAALPEGIRVFGPPMAKQGETWVSVKTASGTAWFVTDGILNEERMPGGPLGLLMKVIGFRAGLITNPFFKRFFLTDKAAYKAWVREELDRDRPTLFVPSHGTVLRGPDVVDRLKEVTDAA